MKNLPQTTNAPDELTEQNRTDNELTWEDNHGRISEAILNRVKEYGTMPYKSTIAEVTGLSRETVRRHLKAVAENPIVENQLDSFSIMTGHVMATVLRAAIKGDLGAAKLFLENSKAQTGEGKKGAKQNSYIQINKTVINQQIIQQLKPEQLERIEEIITKELHKKAT